MLNDLIKQAYDKINQYQKVEDRACVITVNKYTSNDITDSVDIVVTDYSLDYLYKLAAVDRDFVERFISRSNNLKFNFKVSGDLGPNGKFGSMKKIGDLDFSNVHGLDFSNFQKNFFDNAYLIQQKIALGRLIKEINTYIEKGEKYVIVIEDRLNDKRKIEVEVTENKIEYNLYKKDRNEATIIDKQITEQFMFSIGSLKLDLLKK